MAAYLTKSFLCIHLHIHHPHYSNVRIQNCSFWPNESQYDMLTAGYRDVEQKYDGSVWRCRRSSGQCLYIYGVAGVFICQYQWETEALHVLLDSCQRSELLASLFVCQVAWCASVIIVQNNKNEKLNTSFNNWLIIAFINILSWYLLHVCILSLKYSEVFHWCICSEHAG